MPDSSILEEIKLYKLQLDDLLSKRYTDPTLLLGLNNVVQSKFENWIIADCNEYYDSASQGHGQKEFNTIKFLETLWSNFHYPVIKFFQVQHANYYNDVVKEFEQSQVKDTFKPKPVEIRKINDSFIKLVKRLHACYANLMKHFSTFYQNPLIPVSFLNYFGLKVSSNAIQVNDTDTQANFLFLVHKCLLHLGNILRHRSFIEISYVLPCLSLNNFHKFRLMKEPKKKDVMTPYYQKAMELYKLCILLLPALNEPYNHLGVISNFVGDKMTACYWFLRSHFTRVPTYKLGISNLNSLFKKKWFLTNLYEILIESNINDFSSKVSNRKGGFSMGDELHIMILCLIGHYYMPELYKMNKVFIMKKLKYNKVEFVFLNLAFNIHNFKVLITDENEDGLNFYSEQLVFLMCFNKLLSSSRFIGLIFKYIEMFLGCCKSQKFTDAQNANILINLRLIFHWIKEDNYILKKFQTCDQKLLTDLVDVLNSFLEKQYEDSVIDSSDPSSQGSKYSEISELLSSGGRPVRNYYFKEDVLFKDFSIIKFQFKDFKDDHLFEVGDINLLNADFSSLIIGKVPSFLDNRIFLEIEKIEGDSQDLIKLEVLKYENVERQKAVLVMAKKLLVFENEYFKTEFTDRFSLTQKQVQEVSTPRNRKKQQNAVLIRKPDDVDEFIKPDSKVQIENTVNDIELQDPMNKNVDREEQEEEEEQVQEEEEVAGVDSDGSSINEIESFILRHTTQLQHQMNEDSEVSLRAATKERNADTHDSTNESSNAFNPNVVPATPSGSAPLYLSTPIFQAPLHPQTSYGSTPHVSQQQYGQLQFNQTAANLTVSHTATNTYAQLQVPSPMQPVPVHPQHLSPAMPSMYPNYGQAQVVGTPQHTIAGFQAPYSAMGTPYNYGYIQQLPPQYQGVAQHADEAAEFDQNSTAHDNVRK